MFDFQFCCAASTLTEDMNALLRGEVAAEFQDIELMLNGRIIHAHKVTVNHVSTFCIQFASH